MNTKTEQKLLKYLKSTEWSVRERAAKHPNATLEVLLLAMKDNDGSVRRGAARNPNATPEILMVAMRDEHGGVRRRAAENPKIKSLNLSTDKWLELVAGGFFEGNLKNVPPHVKKDPRYKSSRLLSQLAKVAS